MNKKETFPLRLFIIEVIIYLVFFSLLFYLDFYLPDEWPVMLYRQLELAQLPQALQSLDLQISLVLGFLILAIILFATEKISVDIITLALLIGLVVSQILTPAEAFAGFSNDIIIILASIFVISAALQQTGIMDALGGHLLRIAGKSANRLIVLLMAVVGSISMFINNTTATAVFIPPTVGVAHRSGISPSKLLIPLAYASILGGTATLIGTSTNVAVSGYIEQLGLEPLSLFELTPLGLIIMGVGVLYMWGASRYLLPDYKDTDLAAGYAIREYLSEVVVMPGSELIGKRISESKLAKLEFRILAVLRGRRKFRPNVRSKLEGGIRCSFRVA